MQPYVKTGTAKRFGFWPFPDINCSDFEYISLFKRNCDSPFISDMKMSNFNESICLNSNQDLHS